MSPQTWPVHPAYRHRPTPDQVHADPAIALFPGLSIWHKRDGVPYPVEDSAGGLLHAHRAGATAIDGDGQVSREGIPMLTHWAQPLRHGYVDPRGLIRRTAHIHDLTVPELHRLIVPGDRAHPRRIMTLRAAMEYAAGLGITICYEAKDDRRFEDSDLWAQAEHEARHARARLVVMTIQNLGGEPHAAARLRAAHEVGLPTLLLSRGRIDWARWGPVLDAYKGPEGYHRGAPPHVVRLGVGPGDATRYGASCHDGDVERVNAAIRRAGAR